CSAAVLHTLLVVLATQRCLLFWENVPAREGMPTFHTHSVTPFPSPGSRRLCHSAQNSLCVCVCVCVCLCVCVCVCAPWVPDPRSTVWARSRLSPSCLQSAEGSARHGRGSRSRLCRL